MPKAKNLSELTELTSLLYEALRAPIGLLIDSPEPERLRQRLWTARQLAEDKELSRVQIAMSPIEGGSIVIVKVQRGEEDEGKISGELADKLIGMD